ncbi:MAG: ABC transporter substrate-binding protein [Veillonellaceae bacterium]|nr:ABC transporter substrate-binding protein [Veillonellaceae bacterium]
MLALVNILLISFLTAGCFSGSKPRTTPDSLPSSAYLTIKDSIGRTVTIPQKPQRIVLLSPSFVNLLYSVDGKAIGRPNSKSGTIPQAALSVPEVGFVYNINLEKLAALQPDLVIGVQGLHEKLVPSMESNNIPIIILRYKTLEDNIEITRLLGSIAGTQAKAELVIQNIQSQIQTIIAKLPVDKSRKVAILHATSKSVTVELDTTIAGSIAKELGLVNIAAGSMPVNADNDTVPYSMEKLVENDPDIMFVVTMGDKAEIEKRMWADVQSNPAWKSLRAVKEQKVYFLPSELFLLNPGLRMPEAVEYMGKLVYPEVYGSAK